MDNTSRSYIPWEKEAAAGEAAAARFSAQASPLRPRLRPPDSGPTRLLSPAGSDFRGALSSSSLLDVKAAVSPSGISMSSGFMMPGVRGWSSPAARLSDDSASDDDSQYNSTHGSKKRNRGLEAAYVRGARDLKSTDVSLDVSHWLDTSKHGIPLRTLVPSPQRRRGGSSSPAGRALSPGSTFSTGMGATLRSAGKTGTPTSRLRDIRADYSHVQPKVVVGRGVIKRVVKPIEVLPMLTFQDELAVHKVKVEHGLTPRFDLKIEPPKPPPPPQRFIKSRSRSATMVREFDSRKPRRVKSAARLRNSTTGEAIGRREQRLRNERAAIEMQRVFRGWRVRMHIATMIQAAVVIQRRYRIYFWKRIKFLVKIQRKIRLMFMWKMLMKIKRFGFWWKYRRHRCARQIQCLARRWLARCRVLEVRLGLALFFHAVALTSTALVAMQTLLRDFCIMSTVRRKAAVAIQAVWRYYSTRTWLKNKYALIIQMAIRRFTARARVARLKKERLLWERQRWNQEQTYVWAEVVANRAETLTYMKGSEGKKDLAMVKTSLVQAADAVLRGDASGTVGGWWALLLDDAPGGVGYSGKGAGADEIGKPVKTASAVYRELALDLPIAPDPYECERLRQLVQMAHTGLLHDLLREQHTDTFVPRPQLDAAHAEGQISQMPSVASRSTELDEVDMESLEQGSLQGAGGARFDGSLSQGPVVAQSRRPGSGRRRSTTMRFPEHVEVNTGLVQSHFDARLGRRRPHGDTIMMLGDESELQDGNHWPVEGSYDSLPSTLDMHSLDDDAGRHDRLRKKHRRGKVSRRQMALSAAKPTPFAPSLGSMRVFVSKLNDIIDEGRAVPADTQDSSMEQSAVSAQESGSWFSGSIMSSLPSVLSSPTKTSNPKNAPESSMLDSVSTLKPWKMHASTMDVYGVTFDATGGPPIAPPADKKPPKQIANPTLRRMFNMFDVEQRGALDLEQLALLLTEMCVPLDPSDILDMAEDNADKAALARRCARKKFFHETKELRRFERHIRAQRRYLRRKESRWLRRVWKAAYKADGLKWLSQADERGRADYNAAVEKHRTVVRRLQRWKDQAYLELAGIAASWEHGMAFKSVAGFQECVLGKRDRVFTDDESSDSSSESDSSFESRNFSASLDSYDESVPAGHAQRQYTLEPAAVSAASAVTSNPRTGRLQRIPGDTSLAVHVWERPTSDDDEASPAPLRHRDSVGSRLSTASSPLPALRTEAYSLSSPSRPASAGVLPRLRSGTNLTSLLSPSSANDGAAASHHTSRLRQLREITGLRDSPGSPRAIAAASLSSPQSRIERQSSDDQLELRQEAAADAAVAADSPFSVAVASSPMSSALRPRSALPALQARRKTQAAISVGRPQSASAVTSRQPSFVLTQPFVPSQQGLPTAGASRNRGLFQGLDIVTGSVPFYEAVPFDGEQQALGAAWLRASHHSDDDADDENEHAEVSEHETDSSGDKVSVIELSESPSSDSTEDDEWQGRRRDFRMYVTWEQFHFCFRALTKTNHLESAFELLVRNFDRIRASARRAASRQLGNMYDVLARRVILWREHKKTLQAARARFRKRHKPWFACDRCIMTFGFPSQWKAHVKQGCKPKHVRAMVEALQFRTRWENAEAHFEFEHPQANKDQPFIAVTTKSGKIAPILDK